MTFDEWLNGLDTNGVYGDDFAKAAWDAAIDEAVKVVDEKHKRIGAVDGYDYESGEEYGLRSAIITIEKLKK